MKNIVKEVVLDTLSLMDLTIVRIIDKQAVLCLINKLQPYNTDKKLIRFGPKGDGGYLIPDDLNGIQACFSPGVGNLSGFENDCAKRGMQIFLADKSVKFPALENPNFNFIKKHIGPLTNTDFITINDWVSESLDDKDSDLLLQMDIEGYEYSTILNMSNNLLKRFRIIVIEFHSLNKLWDNEFYSIASLVFQKLLQHHTCIHIHPNNSCGKSKIKGVEIPKVAEFTFFRKDRIKENDLETSFPHLLDFDNDPNFKTMILPKFWKRSNKNR